MLKVKAVHTLGVCRKPSLMCPRAYSEDISDGLYPPLDVGLNL